MNAFERIFTEMTEFENYPNNTKSYYLKKDDDGVELTINALGIDPDDISIKTADGKLKITSTSPDSEDNVPFVSDLDLFFEVGSSLDEDTIEATNSNGLLIITIDRKKEKKGKEIKIKTK